MDKGLKEKIIILFNEGKSYNEIKLILGCSKGTISYHCSELRILNDKYSDENISKYQRYYNKYGFNLGKTALFFDIPKSTLRNKLSLIKKPKISVEEALKRDNRRMNNYRRNNKKKAVEYKGGKCQNCGYKKSYYCLSFHHINPKEKDFNISSATMSWDSIKKEIDKCVLVCMNCHGEIHEQLYLIGHSKIVEKILKKI